MRTKGGQSPESTPLRIWSERHAGVPRESEGLIQMRVVKNIPEAVNYLPISQGLIRRRKLERSQRECRKRVAAALQCRSYGGRMDEFSYPRNRRGIRKIVRGL
jgi:hypothetical protein